MATKLQTVEKALDDLPDTASLASSMAAAFAEIEAATKSADNPFFKSKYADLGAIIGTVKPALVKHRLFFTQHCHPSEDGVIVETVLHHAGGESMSMGKLYVPANKRDPQGFGSAQTYARRYALQTAFGVPTEDDDGNAATKAVNDRPSMGEDQPANGPAPRTKLEGQWTSKTALRGGVNAILNAVRKADSDAAINAILKKPANAETIKQAEKDWPELITGDPRIEGDLGLKGYVTRRREELRGSLSFQLLVSTLRECETTTELQSWLNKNGEAVELLDGEESRKFGEIYDIHEDTLKTIEKETA